MPNYSQQQHDSLVAATCKRRHLNFLLLDRSEENAKTYAGGRPTLTTMKRATSYSSAQPSPQAFGNRSSDTLADALKATSAAATRDDSTQALLKSSGQTGQGTQAPAPAQVTQARPTADERASSAGSLDSCDRLVANSSSTTTTTQKSWLLPWQTGNRAEGRRMALAIKSKRTPTGAFARFDMAKPLK